ncbi:hypothetical protein OAX11_05310 [Flavobacteriaceae bacterium]|jgi:hypothetical protein|nr:hypothetical protein [Flavobacteriaceae bacterium]
MFKNISLIFVIIIVLYSCGANKTSENKIKTIKVTFNNQEFNINQFKGKWLTNSRYDKNNFAIFQENLYVLYDDKRYLPYKLKKDSIFVYFDKLIAVGRLINLTDNEVEILWGTKDPKERIKYYRP